MNHTTPESACPARPVHLQAAGGAQAHLFRRGKRGTFYARKRVPTDLVDSYRPARKEVVRSLRTSDAVLARTRLYTALVELNADFARRRAKLRSVPGQPDPQRLRTLSPELLDGMAESWLSSMLHGDEQRRLAGLEEEEFEELGQELAQTRAQLGALLARGAITPILPAFGTLLRLHGYDAELADDDLRTGAYRLLRTVVAGLDLRLQRQAGQDIPTPATPAPVVVADAADWDDCLQAWTQRNPELSRETFYAMQTAWRSLRGFATAQGIPKPGLVTREVVEAWVHHRRFNEGKAPRTVNEQRRKLGQIYTAASKAKLVGASPVVDIETLKVTRRERATLKRLPFSDAELQTWFSYPIFTQHLRSGGQAGEATYWLPVLMYYTGARPEELAGLDASDVRCSREHGHYLRITDLPDAEDAMLQWNRDDRDVSRRDMVASAPRADSAGKRRIKNERSRRSIPIAREVIELGFLDYVESVRVSGHGRLFPTLRPSCKGKVSDAVLKALGRCLRDAGIDDTRKTMYSCWRRCKSASIRWRGGGFALIGLR